MATLTDDDLQLPAFQQFNATPPGTMRPQPPDPNAPMPYGQQMRNVGGSFLDGMGAALRFLVSAPGSGGPLDVRRFDGSQAQANVTTPQAAPVSASGGPDRVGGPQSAPDALPAASTVAKSTAKPTGTARSGAATPAVPPEPGLVPGVTGYYLNDRLVPYGYDPGAPGGVPQAPGAAMPAAGGRGGAPAVAYGGVPGQGALIDPRSYFPDVVGQQLSYARRAADEILSAAGSGSELGYSARLRALTGVYLNGLAQVGQGGANNFNSATAGMFGDVTRAGAQMYSSDNSLKGDLARASASRYSADLGFASNVMQDDTRRYELETSSVPTGTELAADPVTHMAVPTTTYGQRPARAGAMPTPYNTNKPKLVAGQEYTDRAGNRAIYQQDGSWKPVK